MKLWEMFETEVLDQPGVDTKFTTRTLADDLGIEWGEASNWIQSYLARCVPWSPSFPTRATLVDGSKRSATLTGLKTGTQHNCSVVASNSRGSGPSFDAQPIGNVVPKK